MANEYLDLTGLTEYDTLSKNYQHKTSVPRSELPQVYKPESLAQVGTYNRVLAAQDCVWYATSTGLYRVKNFSVESIYTAAAVLNVEVAGDYVYFITSSSFNSISSDGTITELIEGSTVACLLTDGTSAYVVTAITSTTGNIRKYTGNTPISSYLIEGLGSQTPCLPITSYHNGTFYVSHQLPGISEYTVFPYIFDSENEKYKWGDQYTSSYAKTTIAAYNYGVYVSPTGSVYSLKDGVYILTSQTQGAYKSSKGYQVASNLLYLSCNNKTGVVETYDLDTETAGTASISEFPANGALYPFHDLNGQVHNYAAYNVLGTLLKLHNEVSIGEAVSDTTLANSIATTETVRAALPTTDFTNKHFSSQYIGKWGTVSSNLGPVSYLLSAGDFEAIITFTYAYSGGGYAPNLTSVYPLCGTADVGYIRDSTTQYNLVLYCSKTINGFLSLSGQNLRDIEGITGMTTTPTIVAPSSNVAPSSKTLSYTPSTNGYGIKVTGLGFDGWNEHSWSKAFSGYVILTRDIYNSFGNVGSSSEQVIAVFMITNIQNSSTSSGSQFSVAKLFGSSSYGFYNALSSDNRNDFYIVSSNAEFTTSSPINLKFICFNPNYTEYEHIQVAGDVTSSPTDLGLTAATLSMDLTSFPTLSQPQQWYYTYKGTYTKQKLSLYGNFIAFDLALTTLASSADGVLFSGSYNFPKPTIDVQILGWAYNSTNKWPVILTATAGSTTFTLKFLNVSDYPASTAINVYLMGLA